MELTALLLPPPQFTFPAKIVHASAPAAPGTRPRRDVRRDFCAGCDRRLLRDRQPRT